MDVFSLSFAVSCCCNQELLKTKKIGRSAQQDFNEKLDLLKTQAEEHLLEGIGRSFAVNANDTINDALVLLNGSGQVKRSDGQTGSLCIADKTMLLKGLHRLLGDFDKVPGYVPGGWDQSLSKLQSYISDVVCLLDCAVDIKIRADASVQRSSLEACERYDSSRT